VTWTIHKFGGSSLADASCFRRVAGIVLDQPSGNLGVVVSAIGGMTDALLDLISQASSERSATDAIDGLRSRYIGIVEVLLPQDQAAALIARFEQDVADIESVLKALALVKTASNRSRDMISGFGELWSARLLTAVLEEGAGSKGSILCVDARDILVVESGDMSPRRTLLAASSCRSASFTATSWESPATPGWSATAMFSAVR
jgi:aspartokinase/homoserine dehydrogenase 1